MGAFCRKLSVAFAGGTVGALIHSGVVWYLGYRGIPQQLGVFIAPVWGIHFLYPKLVWGGLWGLLFLLPFMRNGWLVSVFSRGIFFSLAPTLVQLFYVFPFVLHKGLLGFSLGRLTPLFVFGYNAVWGLTAAFWVRLAEK